MVRTITSTVRTYAEWQAHDAEHGTSVCEKILEKHRDAEVGDDYWHECLVDSVQEFLEAIGVSNPDVRFSGFWSQGDGARFTGTLCAESMFAARKDYDAIVAEHWVPRDTIPTNPEERGELIPLPEPPPHAALMLAADVNLDAQIKARQSHYVHEQTAYVDFDPEMPGESEEHPRLSAALDAYEERLEAWRLDVCHAIYRSLEAEYEYLTGDDALIDRFSELEEEFDESGDRA